VAQIDPGGSDPGRLQGLGEQADDLGVCFDTGVPIELGAQLQGSRVAVSDDGTAWATLPQ
jgi:hypothetical protein